MESELVHAEKRIMVLKSTIEGYKEVTRLLEERIEVIERSHALDIKLNYTPNELKY